MFLYDRKKEEANNKLIEETITLKNQIDTLKNENISQKYKIK